MELNPLNNEPSRKPQAVREMFGQIAHRYDFLNHFLSGNIDRRWRRVCVREVRRKLGRNPSRTLDVGCGTADLSLEFATAGSVVGCDFCHPMLRIAVAKIRGARTLHPVEVLEGDALRLPFADGSFDAVVSAFVLRNLANLEAGLREMLRVLQPGGTLGVLEFALPATPILGPMYRFYFTKVLPRLGRIVSGVRGPYTYLPASVAGFPAPEELCCLAGESGFGDVEFRRLTFGVAVLILARAPAPG